MKLYKRLSTLLIMTLLLTTFSSPIIAKDYDNHWAKSAIDKWIDKGIINGFEDGSFKPNEALTKAQFSKVLVDLLGYTTNNTAKQYNDVKSTDWFSPYIEKISAAGILHDSGENFYPNAPITREEAAYALMNAFNLKASANTITPTSFKDQDQISTWALDAISTLSYLNYMNGMADGNFNPKGNLTRAEFITLIDRLDLTGKINAATTTPSKQPTTQTQTTPTHQNTTQITPGSNSSHSSNQSTSTEDDDSSSNRPSTPDVLLGGTIYLQDRNGNNVAFPKNFMIQLNLFLSNDRLVLNHQDFNYKDFKYFINETDSLVTGQTYILKALVRNVDNSNEVYYLEETITWPSELVSKDLILKPDDAQNVETDDSTTQRPNDTSTDNPNDTSSDTPTDNPNDTPSNTPNDTSTNTPSDTTSNPSENEDTRTAFENSVLELINEERAKEGAVPLTMDETLREAARYKSDEMHSLNYFAHESPTYGDSGNLLDLFNVSWNTRGENIAQGQTSPEQVVSSWMNSPGHRANILNPNFTSIGIGYNAEGRLWTQVFTG